MAGGLRGTLSRVAVPGAALWPRSVAGIIAAVWSVAMSLLAIAAVVLIAWVLAPLGSGDFGDAMRAAVAFWQLAQGGALAWQGATFSLAPLGLTAVIVLFERRAGAWLARAVDAADLRGARDALAFAVLAVASITALIGNAAANETLHPQILRNGACAGVVAAVGLVWGVLRETGTSLRTAVDDVRPLVSRYLALLVAASGFVLVVLFVIRRGAFGDVLRLVAGDGASRVEVLAVCVVYLPTILLWAMSVLLGPGFTLGTGTHIGVHGVTLGALPPIPLFALVPSELSRFTVGLWLVPAAAAWWVVRGLPRDARGALNPAALARLLGLTAAVFAALGFLGSGGLGAGRLASLGTVWWMPAVSATAWVAAAALLAELVRLIGARIRR